MTAWAATRGLAMAMMSEHHGSTDGYLPAPLILAAALAARTTHLPISIAIFQLPLYDPIRMAEHMCELDIMSGGRVSYLSRIGYVPSEYGASGIDFHRRGKIADEHLELLLLSVNGEPCDYKERHIHVTPPPVTAEGRRLRGAVTGFRPCATGRVGLDFVGQTGGSRSA